MPTPLNVSSNRPWSFSEIGPRGQTNQKVVISKQGYRSLPNEKKSQVLAYNGRIQHGYVIKRAETPVTYGYPPSWEGSAPYTGNLWLSVAKYRDLLGNRAYDKFKDAALGDSTQMGTLLAERKEALGMVANRVTGLYRSYRSLRKGDFKGFLRELSVDPKRKHRSKRRSTAAEASGLWLEYWFGWSPTVNDLYGVADVLTGPLPSQRYHGVSGCRLPERSVVLNTTGNYRKQTEHGFYIVKTGADVELVNPDAQLLQQLGLINPLSIAWEVVPFSFVVDWFTRFGSVIGSYSDFVGCKLTNAYQTDMLQTHLTWETGQTNNPLTYDLYGYYRFCSRRQASLLRPVATFPRLLNYGNSKTRAATAVSLLTQIFLAK